VKRKLAICVILFLASFAVRILVWQNNKIEMATVQSVVTENYLRDATALATGDIRAFLAGPDPPSNARVIDHPPGYPLLIGAVTTASADVETWRVIQIALNSLAAVLLFLIAAALLNERVGMIAGMLAALSPQLAYHSGLLLPDELSVIPILTAVYFFVLAMRVPLVRNALLCGVFLAASCWLRSNALVLPLYFAVAAVALIPRCSRLRFAGLMIMAFVVAIAPITIRNAMYFGSFIPLSLGSGTTFVEGLGDIDDGSPRLPRTDEDVMRLDASLDGSDNQYSSLYDPNGVERDRQRTKYGLSVVRSEPLWFASVVAARGASTFRLERVPAIAAGRDEKDTTPLFVYWANRPLKVLQRAFVTAAFLPFVCFGLIVLWVCRKWRESIVLLVVPLYYATVQPLVHTEYRYVLAIPHLLMIIAAVAICWIAGKVLKLLGRDRESAAAAQ